MVPIIRPAGITALLSADSSISTTDCEPATDTTRPMRWFYDSSRNEILSASGTMAVDAVAATRGSCFGDDAATASTCGSCCGAAAATASTRGSECGAVDFFVTTRPSIEC